MPTMKRPSTIRKRCETRPHSVQPTPQTADMRFTACFFEPLSAKKEKGSTNTVMPSNTAERPDADLRVGKPEILLHGGENGGNPQSRGKVQQKKHVKHAKAEKKPFFPDGRRRFVGSGQPLFRRGAVLPDGCDDGFGLAFHFFFTVKNN